MRTSLLLSSRLLCALPLVLTLACTSDDTAEGGTETSGDGDGDPAGDGDGDASGDGDGDVDPSVCPEAFISGDPNDEVPPPFVDCDLESPCEAVMVDLDASMTTGGDEDVQNPDALDCVLASLDSGARASHSFFISSSISSESLNLRVYDGGRAELSRDAVFDSAFDKDRIPHQIDEGTTFVDCSGLLWSDVWSCVRDGLLDCATWGSTDELCG